MDVHRREQGWARFSLFAGSKRVVAGIFPVPLAIDGRISAADSSTGRNETDLAIASQVRFITGTLGIDDHRPACRP